MLRTLAEARNWPPAQLGGPLAAAIVVQVSGSAPRPVGTTMLISDGGELLGSLSGGCIEGAVVEAALETMETGQAQRSRFSYTDQDAFAVGLTCGGTIEVHIQPLPTGLPNVTTVRSATTIPNVTTAPSVVVARLDPDKATVNPSLLFVESAAAFDTDSIRLALASLLAGEGGTTVPAAVVRGVAERLQLMATAGGTSLLEVGGDGEWCDLPEATLLVDSQLPAPRFLIFGANDFGAAMISQAALLGYEATVCDPRPAFATQTRFASAHEVVSAWPHKYLRQESEAGRLDARAVVCVLGHDPKFDIPLLEFALGLDLAYLGALGSRLSHAKRIDALLERGLAPELLATLHSPIGLDLGAATPSEVAVSIAAGVIAHRNGRATGAQLSNGSGAIHALPTPFPIDETINA